jgi:cell division protein FtsQ
MSFKNNIRKILFVAMWCIAGSGMLVLLIAAINNRNGKACKGYKITIDSPSGHLFVTNKIIENIITDNGSVQLQGRPISSFNLKNTEERLEQNVWIKNAEIFFDNDEVLRISVRAREPMARVFTKTGNSFYIDSSGTQLPLEAKLPIKLPVFTGYPYKEIKNQGTDSPLLADIKAVANFILNDSFWMAQIEQIDVTSGGTFELTPVIGNQVIEFGDGTDYKAKFERLFIFYKEVLTKTGFNKYTKINVQYKGQVIGTRKGGEMVRSDSLKFMKDVRQLIKSAQQLQADTVKAQNIRPLENNGPPEQLSGDEESAAGDKDSLTSKMARTKNKIGKQKH